MEKIIESVVVAFYEKATTDFLIGYHFRKIASINLTEGHPLKPPMEAFSHHLPRINIFWKNQLLGTPLPEGFTSFDLIKVHQALLIRKGEVGRWVQLFEETLNETVEDENFRNLWLEKLELFKNRFLNHPALFKRD